MRIKKVWAVYFSGTGTTEKTVRRIAAGMAQALDAELAVYDFTTPAARQRELRFGAEQDFYTDAGSMKYGPFVAFYGLQFQEAIQVDIMLKYTAIKSGSYDVMVVYATDGLNKDANLTILEDDKSFFPEYNGVLTVRDGLFEDFADRAPELEQTLELLTGQFTNEVMSELTYRVDVLGEPKNFLPMVTEFAKGRLKVKMSDTRAELGEVAAKGKKPGRGAYVCHDVECLKKARKSRALERAFTCFDVNNHYEPIKRNK